MRATLAASLLIWLGVAGCARDEGEKPADPKGVAEAQSRLAATPEQASLWQKAAGTALGLEKAPVVENPVVPRPRVSFPDRKAPEPEVSAQFSASATGVRVLSAPDLPDRAFEGAAKVLQAEGDRLVLDFGNQRVLNLQIRVGGSPLRAAAGAFAQVDLRIRRGQQARREIIAIRLAENDGILSVLESGREPIALKVPLFQLTARQVGNPEAGTMPVEIRVGSESKVLAPGQSAEFSDGRLTVLLESSTAVTGAAAAADAEGPPFAMRLRAWPTQ